MHDDFIDWGEHVSRKRIIRLKQEEGRQARVRTRYKVTTDSDHGQPVADNLLQQDFTAERPNQRWAGDTSETPHRRTRESLPGGYSRSVFTSRRGLGDQRRQ
jgi:transposase InsO family protein